MSGTLAEFGPFFIAEDGHGDLSLWRRTTDPSKPQLLIRKHDLGEHADGMWLLLLRGLRDYARSAT